ncbi:hypothetical protein ACM66B_006830 [Microbotryomycetes sp. NB124-2]
MPTRHATVTTSNIKSPPLPELPPPSPAPVSRVPGSKWSGSTMSATGAPNLPSSLRDQPRHERRPSRAERYEQTVDSARSLLRRTATHAQVGLGIDGSCHQSPVATQTELRDAVSNLIKVIDGMSRQLATHDELAAQLKIAQSNLTLAETHSQFLEETLKKRDSRSSVQMVARHSASGAPLPTLPPPDVNGNARGSSRPSSSNSNYSKDLPPTLADNDNNSKTSSASAFFARLPSVRKPVSSMISTASTSSSTTTNSRHPSTSSNHHHHHHHAKRSSSSSPHRQSEAVRNRMSADLSSHPSPRDLSSKSTAELVQEVIALHHQVSSLEQSYYGLQTTNTSLRRSADKFATKCAELEKTKDDLMAELENLSMELFQEANTMVAEERKNRAQAEEEVERLRQEVAKLRADLDHVRKTGSLPPVLSSDIGRGSVSSATTTGTFKSDGTLRARDAAAWSEAVASLPTPKPDTGTTAALRAVSPSSSTSLPLGASSPATASPDPDTASLNSNSSSRKWFQFGRNLSRRIKGGTASDDAETLQDSVSTASPNPLTATTNDSHQQSSLAPPTRAPAMARANSGSSVQSMSSVASSFFSTVSNDGTGADSGHVVSNGAGSSSSSSNTQLNSQSIEELADGLTPMPQSTFRHQDGLLPVSSAAIAASSGNNARLAGSSPTLHIETANLSQFPRSESNNSLLSSTGAAQRAAGLVSVFSPDSSTGPPSSSVDDFLRQEQQQQQQLNVQHTRSSPRITMAAAFGSTDPTKGKPVAVRSFEGEGTAKSPKTPNERRWEKLAGQIPLSSSSGTTSNHSSAPATSNGGDTEAVRPRSPLGQTAASSTAVGAEDSKRRPVALDLSNVRPSTTTTTTTTTTNNARSGVRRRSTESAGSPIKSSAQGLGPPTASSSSSSTGGRPKLGRAASSASTMTLGSSSNVTTKIDSRSLKPSSSTATTTTGPEPSKYLQPLASPTSYVSPLTKLDKNGTGVISTSTSMSSLGSASTSARSPTAVEDLEGLMRNIQDMSLSLFGDDQSEEWGLNARSAEAVEGGVGRVVKQA